MVECQRLLKHGCAKECGVHDNSLCEPHVKKKCDSNTRNDCNGNKHPSSREEANALIKKVTKDFPESIARSSTSSSRCKEMSSEKEGDHNSDHSSSVLSSDSDSSASHNNFNINVIDRDKKPVAKVRAPKAKRAKTPFKGVPVTKMSAEERAYQANLKTKIDPEVEDRFTSDSE